jgi:hypothetical protein
MGQSGAQIWLFIGFVFGFGSIIGSIWIFFAAFVAAGPTYFYPGVALFLQNLLIFSG